MNAVELLTRLEAQGVDLLAVDDKLRVRAARGQLSDELKAAISVHKEGLLRLIKTRTRNRSSEAEGSAIEPVSEGEFPLSFAQRRLWFLDRLEPGNRAYNLSASFDIDDVVDNAALVRAINEVVRRHGSLRTVFREIDGEPIQVVERPRPVQCEVIDLTHLAGEARTTEAARQMREEAAAPFDLVKGPVFRTKLIRLDAASYRLLFSMHHIVSDAWSLGIFLDELVTHYRAYRTGTIPSVPPLPVQYGTYAVQERAALDSPELERLLGYWRKRMVGAPPTLDLPTDRPRPSQRSHNGALLRMALPKALSDGIRALARRERATVYMTLLAMFNALLHRYTGQADIVVGTSIANRPRPELEPLIGLFVSTLPIRGDISGDPSSRALIARIRESVLDAQAHQELPFEKLVEELRPERTMASSPIFQVAFVLQSAPIDRTLAMTSTAAIFDLTMYLRDDPAGIVGAFEYDTDLFDAATIERMSRHFVCLAEAAVADPDAAISRLQLLAPAERRELIAWAGKVRVDKGPGWTLHERFEQQVRRGPEAVALRYEGDQLTYAELEPSSEPAGT